MPHEMSHTSGMQSARGESINSIDKYFEDLESHLELQLKEFDHQKLLNTSQSLNFKNTSPFNYNFLSKKVSSNPSLSHPTVLSHAVPYSRQTGSETKWREGSAYHKTYTNY